jgi:hypothetical protein
MRRPTIGTGNMSNIAAAMKLGQDRELFERLDRLQQIKKVPKAEFVRRALQHCLPQFERNAGLLEQQAADVEP